MTRLVLAVACCALAGGSVAQAQVTNVTGSSSTMVQLPTGGVFTSTGSGPGLESAGTGAGAAYFSSFSSTPTTIQFESANATHGIFLGSTSSSVVNITIKNGGSTAVTPTLNSTITGAGLGVYVANTGGACGGSSLFSGMGGDPYGGCAQTTSGTTITSLNAAADPNVTVADAKFEFTIAAGGTTIYDLVGIEKVVKGDGNFLIVDPLVLTLNGVATSGELQGLTHETPGMAGSADGYLWNESPVSVSLGSALASGASEDVTYTATVSTFNFAQCATANPTDCLVPYAAFGDPIGKSGGTNSAARLFGAQGEFPAIGPDGIPFVDDWGPQTFHVPTFDFNTGVLTFNGVPEPKTWMSMILGFGLLGAALRRRRVLSYA
jgi:hypothetical protein